MNLLFCIKAMNNSGGGAERVLADVANGLVGRGHAVRVLSYDRPGGTSFYPLDRRIGRIELGIGSTVERATVPITLVRMRALRREVARLAPDVVIGFMHSMYIPLGLALYGSGTPLIASEHIVPQHYRSRPLESALMLLAPLLVSQITCVSPEVRELYPAHIRRKMVAVANPVTVRAGRRADVLGGPGGRKLLLTVGRLEDQKDQAALIRAFGSIAGEFPDWDLRIVGEGSLRRHLEALAADLGIADRVQMPGPVSDIGSEYQSAQLFALPSRYESFGLSLAEALAHGLPAVGFDDCAGVDRLIRPGVNGMLVSPGEDRAASLAIALRAMMGNAGLRQTLSRNAVDTASEYGLDSVLDRWESLMFKAVARGRRKS